MKKILILTLAALFVFTGCSSKGEEKEYFDFTVTELVDELEYDNLIDLTQIAVVDGEEKNEKIATYTATTEILDILNEVYNDDVDSKETIPVIHLLITYDNETNKVSYISFFNDSQQFRAKEHFNYHILCLASCIDPDIDTDVVLDEIENNKMIIGESEASSYYTEKFTLNTHYNDSYYDANFTPPEKETK